MSHHCRRPGCSAIVGNALWGCEQHWRALPDSLRTWIGRAYRQGMDRDRLTYCYLRAHRAAILFAREIERGRD
ncbi:hypothetical protein SAMN05445504_9234 [Burkholderia sp. CF099]|nr:hypothetical protein SAMN05445504_9234 [Burkholderia sp. CF099]